MIVALSFRKLPMFHPFAKLILCLFLVLAAQHPAAVVAQSPPTFVLGAGDQIEVNVVNYPDLKTTTRVTPQGRVVLPLIGDVQVDGLTPADAANLVETFYVNGGFIKLPTVRIEVLDYQSRKASVLGQVNNQGLVVLDRGYSIAEILAKVGGLTAEAGETAVIVRPRRGGGEDRIVVEIGDQVSAATSVARTTIEAGDVVFVPKAPTFSIIGAVVKAGSYRLGRNMTVEQALAAAGDISVYGSRSGIKIRRAGANGGITTTIPVQLGDAVRPDDIIIVKERLF